MIGKIAIVASILIGLVLMGMNTFKFSGDQGVQSSSNSQPSSSQTQPDSSQTPASQTPNLFGVVFDPVGMLSGVSRWFSALVQSFSSYLTERLRGIFPSASNNFGTIVLFFILLVFMYLMATKFENIFRALILGLMIVAIVLLMMSALGVF